MPSSDIYLSLIVPAFNESATIVATLTAIRDYLSKQTWSWEVIVSADGTDGTRQQAGEFAGDDGRFIVIGEPTRRGKGRGVRDGVFRAKGAVIGFLDADYKTPVDEIEKILPILEQGYDVVIGSRRMGASQVEIAQPLYRRAGSRVFALLMRTSMGLPDVHDTQCGFKFFTRSAALRLFSLQRIDGYMFDIEILRLTKILHLWVKEIGVRWRDDGDSRYDPIRGTIRNLKELIRIRKMKYEPTSLKSAQAERPLPARIAA